MAFSYSPKIVTDGLVLYLDAGNTESYPGSGTVWSDLSRGQNSGTLTNGPTFDSGNGGSIVFDGVDDYVNLGTPILGESFTSFTFSFIFNFTNTSASMVLIDTRTVDRDGVSFIISQPSGDVLYTSLGLAGNTQIEYGVPQHVNCTYDGTTVKFYVNGVLDASSDISTSFSNVTTDTFIGSRSFNFPYGSPDGSIYTAQIYNRALSADEVLQNYNATKGRFGL